MSVLKINQTREYVINKGKEHGCETFFADPDELFLDLDRMHIPTELDEPILRFMECINQVNGQSAILANYPMLYTTSRNGNKHLYIRLARPTPELVRIALQACLGSDPTREFLAAMQSEAGMEAAVALFERKPMAELVREWRSKASFL